MRSPDISGALDHAPAVARNRAPILDALRTLLPSSGLVLEIASGTGEHAAYFAAHFPKLTWQPSDHSERALDSIAAHRAAAALPNLSAPRRLDAAAPDWPLAAADVVLAINMIHIAPWAATQGLMAGAGRVLSQGGLLALYGPYREADVTLSPSNAAFDADLKRRDPSWGLRARADVEACAALAGLRLIRRVEMPANNLLLAFARA